MGMTARIAAFAAQTEAADISPEAHRVGLMSLLDWVAVGLAGCEEPVARIAREQALSEAGAAQASVFGSRTRVPARAAALVNGATSHALDYDDTHFLHVGHPTVAPKAPAVPVW